MSMIDTAARCGNPLVRLLFAIPLIGWMLREIAADPARGALPLVLNVVLALAVLTWFFGFVVIMATVMAAAVLVLGLIMYVSSDFAG